MEQKGKKKLIFSRCELPHCADYSPLASSYDAIAVTASRKMNKGTLVRARHAQRAEFTLQLILNFINHGSHFFCILIFIFKS